MASEKTLLLEHLPPEFLADSQREKDTASITLGAEEKKIKKEKNSIYGLCMYPIYLQEGPFAINTVYSIEGIG